MQIRYVLSHMHTREKIFKSLTKQWIALQIMDSGFHSFLVPTIFIDLRYFYLPPAISAINIPSNVPFLVILTVSVKNIHKYSQ